MNNKISKFSFIVFNSFIYYTLVNALIIPYVIDEYGKESFIYVLGFTIIALVVIYLYSPKLSLYTRILKGKFIRYILSFYFIVSTIILIVLSTIVIKQYYPLTNEFYFYGLFLIVGSVLAFYGINTIINLATPIFLVIPVFIIIPIIFAERELDYQLVLPFQFSWNILPLLALLFIPFDMITCSLYNYTTHNKVISKSTFAIPLFITMFLCSLNLLTSISTFSIGFLKDYELPGFVIYDSLKISKNFDNYDVVLIFFVTTTSFFKIAYNLNIIRVFLHIKNTMKRYIFLGLFLLFFMMLIDIYNINLNNYYHFNIYLILGLSSIFFIYHLLMRFKHE